MNAALSIKPKNINLTLGQDVIQYILSFLFFRDYVHLCVLWNKLSEANQQKNVRDKCNGFATSNSINFVVDYRMSPLNYTEKNQCQLVGPFSTIPEALLSSRDSDTTCKVFVKDGCYAVDFVNICDVDIIALEGRVMFRCGFPLAPLRLEGKILLYGIDFAGALFSFQTEGKNTLLRTMSNCDVVVQNCSFKRTDTAIAIWRGSKVRICNCWFTQTSTDCAIQASAVQCNITVAHNQFRKIDSVYEQYRQCQAILIQHSKMIIHNKYQYRVLCPHFNSTSQNKYCQLEKSKTSKLHITGNVFVGDNWSYPIAEERPYIGHCIQIYKNKTDLFHIAENVMRDCGKDYEYNPKQSVTIANTLFQVDPPLF